MTLKRCEAMLEKSDGTWEQCAAPASAINVGEVHESIEKYHRGMFKRSSKVGETAKLREDKAKK